MITFNVMLNLSKKSDKLSNKKIKSLNESPSYNLMQTTGECTRTTNYKRITENRTIWNQETIFHKWLENAFKSL